MKLPVPFLQLPLRFDAGALAAEVLALGVECWRPHPNGLPGNEALTLITTGGDPDSDEVAGPMRPTPYLKRCGYLRQVLSCLGATWGRTRLMKLSGQAEVTPHVDLNYYWRERMRVHVPILTQPTVRFACGEAEINMAAGECWIFDTWRTHRVVNDAEQPRIHLVADTVGGETFWEHMAGAKPPEANDPGWQARHVPPAADAPVALDYESVNLPAVMSPWEVREHIFFLLGESEQTVQLQRVAQSLMSFARRWHALWSCYGEAQDGLPRYRALLDEVHAQLRAEADGIALRNGASLLQALNNLVLGVALGAPAPAAA